MFCTHARSCARADDAKIVRSRDAQCKTREYLKEKLKRKVNLARNANEALKQKNKNYLE